MSKSHCIQLEGNDDGVKPDDLNPRSGWLSRFWESQCTAGGGLSVPQECNLVASNTAVVESREFSPVAARSDAIFVAEAQSQGFLLRGGLELRNKSEPGKNSEMKEEPATPVKGLEGKAVTTELDPDASNRELLIEWDYWRNKVAERIQRNLKKHLQGWDGMEYKRELRRIDPKFPYGIDTAVGFVVNAEQKVVMVTVAGSSGYPEYDELVVKSVFELNKKRQAKLLQFPEHSRRKKVRQVVDYKTSDHEEHHYIKFGDIERVKE